MKDLSVEWEKLCEEYEVARDEHLKAWAIVTGQFAEIANHRSTVNPTDQQMRTWKAWLQVRRRMDEFVKKRV